MKIEVVDNFIWAKELGFITFKYYEDYLYKPGQVVMLSVLKGVTDPFLRRPFAPYSIDDESKLLTFLYAIVGKGTTLLSKAVVGDELDISVAHGRGYTVLKDKKVALIAGGAGLAPINMLAEKLYENGCEVHLYHGCRTQALIFPNILKDAENKFRLHIATEDGTQGFHGLATENFLNDLSEDNRFDMVYTCGPRLMMKEVKNICNRFNLSLEISTEEHMACGVGVCYGCMVETIQDGRVAMKRCCSDGPVFNANQVVL